MKVERETRITLRTPVSVTQDLKRLRERAGLSMEEMARALRYKTPSGYQRYEDATLFKKEFLPVDLVSKLLQLLPGRGEPPIDSMEVLGLAGLAQLVNKTAPDSILTHVTDARQIPKRIPIIRWDQVTMYLSGKLKQEDIERFSDPGDFASENSFVTTLVNNSAEPDFPQGDRLVCDREAAYQPGNVVLATIDKSDTPIIGTYKLIGEDDQGPIIEVIPINPNWLTVRIDSQNPGKIQGRIVEHRRTVR